MHKYLKRFSKKILCGIYFIFLSVSSFATTNANMIWEKNTKDISASVSGPVAMGIGTITIVVAALGWAITDGGTLTGKAIKLVLALTIAGGATALTYGLFGLTGGATII
ncbi:MAG: TrbC/VirB2 family protein [Fusobacterium gastrosuis]|uniref:TrbC/VirB2 family protein n=1 Tax=Fusobacterium TaxID=848 RepID=UPI0025BD94BF|nr:TrbC/VirB2 family protein [Fusobacterium sp.]MCI7224321.1 TrbC/VirB2 family protein [Fusobacterium sp.]MDY5794709.1 TrbC/VirB2 family protein [Fusobacterium gastrosuis]